MSAERFADRFRHYKDLPHQQQGVQQLYEAIAGSNQSSAILNEQAPWAVTYRTRPTQPPVLAGGLDPRGSEEAGMVGPKISAPVQVGDSYLLINDRDEDMEAYSHSGEFLWRVPCLARGVGGPDWRKRYSDTPPGLYLIGQVYRDYEQNRHPPQSDTAESYGWYSFDLVELEGQEAINKRAGIMLHGGGSACGWPGAWAPRQRLYPTLGCLRAHNIDLRDKVLPLTMTGTVYVGVFQDRY
jgi:hypothetical protein